MNNFFFFWEYKVFLTQRERERRRFIKETYSSVYPKRPAWTTWKYRIQQIFKSNNITKPTTKSSKKNCQPPLVLDHEHTRDQQDFIPNIRGVQTWPTPTGQTKPPDFSLNRRSHWLVTGFRTQDPMLAGWVASFFLQNLSHLTQPMLYKNQANSDKI